MLYYLFDWLHKLNFPGAGMFGYTSFRALMAIILALLISSIWGDKFIKLLKRKQITETQRVNDIYQKFYGTVNAKVGVRKGIVNVNLWSRNITNTHYSAFYFESFGNPFIQLGKPFQIGAEVAIAF